jgi:3,4-dihydroxy-2-butanone 4-phosphate synthase
MAPVALQPTPTTFAHLKQDTVAIPSEPSNAFSFDSMGEALEAFARGEFIVVTDDESRENEGDLIIAASKITTEKMAWFIKMTRYRTLGTVTVSQLLMVFFSGYVCISLPQERLDALKIPMMVPQNEDKHKTAYTVTVDYKHGKFDVAVLCHDLPYHYH